MKLIDKADIVAKIQKRIDETESMRPAFDQFWAGQISAFNGVLKILDTLEVKEIDLDFMLHEYWNLSPKITIDCLESATMTKDEMINFAKHFFELGLKTQKGE